uniref:SOCS box domain-containing protein n=1 Tax=Oncorhynchus mykiss TaxID=8022 RepID=A0A8K9UR98_ONCMY
RVLTLRNLIAQGTCVNLVTLERVSPLHGACLQGHTACAKLQIENGANVNVPTLEQTTPLSEACAQGHVACVTLLLQHGALPEGYSLSASPIHQAAAKDQGYLCPGHPEYIESQVHHGADVDQHTDQSGSPLYTACTNQHLSTVKKLLQLGASVNSSKDGDSPLNTAARLSNPELIRDTQGKQPLDLASCNSPVEKIVLGHRGDPFYVSILVWSGRELGWAFCVLCFYDFLCFGQVWFSIRDSCLSIVSDWKPYLGTLFPTCVCGKFTLFRAHKV